MFVVNYVEIFIRLLSAWPWVSKTQVGHLPHLSPGYRLGVGAMSIPVWKWVLWECLFFILQQSPGLSLLGCPTLCTHNESVPGTVTPLLVCGEGKERQEPSLSKLVLKNPGKY